MNTHTIISHQPALSPEEGFLLGNGDLSCSLFFRQDTLVLRLGKGDLWDCRLNIHANPPPADIAELRDLVLKEDIHCDGPSGKLRSASRHNPRLAQLSVNKALASSAPNPKPAAEILIHCCGDLRGRKLEQKLMIEQGAIEVKISWDNNVSILLRIAVHPDINKLCLRWKVCNWHQGTWYGGHFYGLVKPYPVFFELQRKTEKKYFEYLADNLPHICTNGHDAHTTLEDNLPPAKYTVSGSVGILSQQFPDRNLNILGFSKGTDCRESGYSLLYLPEESLLEGELCVCMEYETHPDWVVNTLQTNENDVFIAAKIAAERFFAVSSVSFSNPDLENMWYSTMHAKRCVLRSDTMPPGLLLPSTIKDYSSWHGDYHMNYNYQSMFLGDFSSGHFDTGDAFFTGLAPLLRLGHKIAFDYYHCKGCFVQLSGFPFDVEEDYLGNLPFGRMAYMTGWIAAWFFRRWDFSRDRNFLQNTAYPALRDFALFYSDFLSFEEDGFYHAFPSNQGEEDYSLAGTKDQPQVLRHAQRTLEYAIICANELNCDAELCKQWSKILAHLAPGGSLPDGCAAEFAGFDGCPPVSPDFFLTPGTKYYDWYPGQVPYFLCTALRNGMFSPKNHCRLLENFLKRWTFQNKLFQAMPVSHYGHEGFWSEGLGIAGALIDMLILNRNGVLEFFPGIAENAAFENLLTEGGYKCSAKRHMGHIADLLITPAQNGICCIRTGWHAAAIVSNGSSSILLPDLSGIIRFKVMANTRYHLDEYLQDKNSCST